MATSKIETNRTLLWTNSNPTATFSPQTLSSVDISNYKYIEIEYYITNSSNSNLLGKRFPIGGGGDNAYFLDFNVSVSPTINALTIYLRGHRYTNNNIEFYEGKRMSSGTMATDNTRMIPYRIYGIY